jgi:hypothetical protein
MGEQLMTIMLNGSDLTVTQVVAAARHGEAVALARRLADMVQLCEPVVELVTRGDLTPAA